jgi:glycosyltransferase involved in cell wall biosynthesis
MSESKFRAGHVERQVVVILSTADYDAAVWTNKQHIASRLAEFADVYYINSLGLRRPNLTTADMRRLWSRLRNLIYASPASSPKDDGRRPFVLSPTVIPFHGRKIVEAVNTRLLRISLNAIPLEDAVLWTFSPMTHGLERRARRVVYHSVDLLHTLPRLPAEALLGAEAKLVAHADRVVASSTEVKNHLSRLGRADVLLWPNVADVQLYIEAASRVRRRVPRAVFAGNLTSSKVNFELLRRVAERGIEVVLAGPVSVDGSRDAGLLDGLLRNTNVRYVGNLAPVQLAEYFAESMVGMIPYRLNEYTRGVYPMKLWEYLAAGLSVVSVRLPSLIPETVPGAVLVEESAFESTVVQAVERFTMEGARSRMTAAVGHSWESRLDQVRSLLEEMDA